MGVGMKIILLWLGALLIWGAVAAEEAAAQYNCAYGCAGTWGCSNCRVKDCDWENGFCYNSGTESFSGNCDSRCEIWVPGVNGCHSNTTYEACEDRNRGPVGGTRSCCNSAPTPTPTPPPGGGGGPQRFRFQILILNSQFLNSQFPNASSLSHRR